MIAELGVFSLILALMFSLALVVVPATGLIKNRQVSKPLTDFYVYGLAIFIIFAYLLLSLAFFQDDFSLRYVLNNSSKILPTYYKLCAVWGGHEGSMLLWVLVLSIWTVLITKLSFKLHSTIRTKMLIVLGFVAFSFILFILTTSNPFARQFELLDTLGRDLNPLLQDPGFLFHPPTLYIGYVGLSFPFAFAVAALWKGEFDTKLARSIKPWILLAWCFLTAGITLGSWWAYRELGWGGWWFWDPVENASLMPWLVCTALIHAFIASEKRQQLIPWTLFLAIIGFGLSILGTFLVRSGVLTSVHSFAADPKRGLYILGLLIVVLGGSFTLFAFRAHKFQNKNQPEYLSRENALLFNSILFFVLMLSILLGTIYPLIIDAFGLGKLSVGAPYFNTVIIPLFLPLLIIMGMSVYMKWQVNSWKALLKSMQLPLILVLCATLFSLAITKGKEIQVTISIVLVVWILSTAMHTFYLRLKNRNKKITGSFLGMTLAHIGIAISVLGIAVSTGFGVETDVKMAPGDTVNFDKYKIKFVDEEKIKGPNYHGTQGKFQIISKNSTKDIFPEKRIYDVGQMAMTDSAIDVTPFRDIYVALGDPVDMSAWTVRLYYKPLVRWIWAGGFIMLIGGLFSIADRKYLVKK